MTEKLFQFLWQLQYFNRSELTTTTGEHLRIIFQGNLNTNQGPDFSNAKIKIGSTTWAGSVELHIKTSDWDKHRHQVDANYNNVILHVVWEDDGQGSEGLPVLEMKDRVSKLLLKRYEELMNSTSFIPCEKSIQQVSSLAWKGWKDRLLVERLMRKTKTVEDYLQQNNFHWEETFWWLLARNFGIKVNADAFEAIAKSLPLAILSKHKNQLIQLEALLFGQAGLLGKKFTEDYPKLLYREYMFLKSKYKLKPIHIPVHLLRMRPGNFPTVRLAQLAALINKSAHLFSRIKDAESLAEIIGWFNVIANDYWHYHYRFGETSSFREKRLGADMIDNIIINTVVPVLFAYGNFQNEQKIKDKAVQLLEETESETNAITKGFLNLGIKSRSAFDSQALIELKTQYCDGKRCLDCGIGNFILKNRGE